MSTPASALGLVRPDPPGPLTRGSLAPTIPRVPGQPGRNRPYARKSSLLVAFLYLFLLPSCTQYLWSGPTQIQKTVLLDESREVTAGVIAVRDDQIVWRSADGVEQLAIPGASNANTVKMVLSHPAHVDVRKAQIEFRETIVDGKLVGGMAELTAVAKPVVKDIAYVVSRETLTPEALTGLSVGLLGDLRVPTVYRELVHLLPFLDLGAVIGRAGVYSLESQVFLAADGTQAFTAALAPNDQAPVTSVRQRLALLAEVSLLLQLQGPEGALLVRARPDSLWLLSQLDMVATEAGLLRVPLELVPVATADAAGIDGHVLPAEYVHLVANYERMMTGGTDRSVWTKIVLTPFTLAADVVIAVLVVTVLIWLADDDDE
ncbi:MAG: hypothetical protein ACI90M_002549 [Candidatus Azotimanducaceae bacterium]|jgi:hypothetical protein